MLKTVGGPAVVAGLLAGCIVILGLLLTPTGWREVLRERTFDVILQSVAPFRRPYVDKSIVVVDIDTASLAEIGAWPWRREAIAELIAAVNTRQPLAVGLDMLLAGPDTRSPAALARQLGNETGREELIALAPELVDGDKALIEAMRDANVVLGWVLDPRGKSEIVDVPILIQDGATLGALWREAGATGPIPDIAAAAAGGGTLSLPGDEDGLVRRVPLLVAASGEVRPSLALEVLRIAEGASGYLVSGKPARLTVGELTWALPNSSFVRLAPIASTSPIRSVSAAALMRNRVSAPLAGAFVIIGSSAPELGGLRPSAQDPLTASAMLHAAALRQLIVGVLPSRPLHAVWLESGAALICLFVAVAAARRLRPLQAALVIALALVGGLIATLIAASSDTLFDPVPAIAAAGAGFLVTSLVTFSETRLREARLRRRFEQHLAPGVVERIIANPSILKLAGERREVTAFFTDIENFTDTTRAVGPEQLLLVLDRYFDGVTGIVVAHGGMIDKIVGDAVHALFNAPFDLNGHAKRAVACAIAIRAWTEDYRRTGLAAEIGLGRTRVGVETGSAIVGDVGFGAKVDYTAHGDAVNMAARLEALNKELGTTICIGPAAAALCDAGALRNVGRIDIRGLGTSEVFTPVDPLAPSPA